MSSAESFIKSLREANEEAVGQNLRCSSGI